MKMGTSFYSLVGAALLMVLASAGIGAAGTGTDTCFGGGASIGSTCTPLTNATSVSDDNTAFGADDLEPNTTGTQNTAIGARALSSNTEGGANTAIGVQALQAN